MLNHLPCQDQHSNHKPSKTIPQHDVKLSPHHNTRGNKSIQCTSQRKTLEQTPTGCTQGNWRSFVTVPLSAYIMHYSLNTYVLPAYWQLRMTRTTPLAIYTVQRAQGLEKKQKEFTWLAGQLMSNSCCCGWVSSTDF